jgi:hypothetical protein
VSYSDFPILNANFDFSACKKGRTKMKWTLSLGQVAAKDQQACHERQYQQIHKKSEVTNGKNCLLAPNVHLPIWIEALKQRPEQQKLELKQRQKQTILERKRQWRSNWIQVRKFGKYFVELFISIPAFLSSFHRRMP